MRSNPSRPHVFALKAFSIKCDRGKFFVSPTNHSRWSGPYRTLQHATTAIARHLAREFAARHKRSAGVRP